MALPFIIDVAGNALDLYNTIVWFDDVAHAVTFMLLVLAVVMPSLRLDLEPWIAAGLSIGFGAVAHILWEIIEFVAMWIGSPGLQLTYEDTIGDLALALRHRHRRTDHRLARRIRALRIARRLIRPARASARDPLSRAATLRRGC